MHVTLTGADGLEEAPFQLFVTQAAGLQCQGRFHIGDAQDTYYMCEKELLQFLFPFYFILPKCII